MSDEATQAALREISRTMGGLESTVKSMVQTWQAQESSASQGRRDLHQKFDRLSADFHKLAGAVEGVLQDVDEIKPSVKAFENAKHQAEGAQTLGKIIWGALLAVGGGIGWALANWISIGPKPPLH